MDDDLPLPADVVTGGMVLTTTAIDGPESVRVEITDDRGGENDGMMDAALEQLAAATNGFTREQPGYTMEAAMLEGPHGERQQQQQQSSETTANRVNDTLTKTLEGSPPLHPPPPPAIDPDSLHPFLEATTAQDLADFMQVPLRALGCVELMVTMEEDEDGQIRSSYIRCTTKNCPYPAAYRTASGNKNGTFPKCVLHNKQWYPKPPRKAHFLLGHEYLRPQNKPFHPVSAARTSPESPTGTTQPTTTKVPKQLPPCCWQCCCGDDYCKGIGYTPHARSIPVRHVEGVLEALPFVKTNPVLQQKIRLQPKNFSVAPWHFHPNARILDANGRWKLKPLDTTLVYAQATGEIIEKNANGGDDDPDNNKCKNKNRNYGSATDGKNNNMNTSNDGDWDGDDRWRGERVWRGFPPPTYDIRKFVELEVLPQLAIGGIGEMKNLNCNKSASAGDTVKKSDLPLWAVEMAKADIQNIRCKLPPEFFLKPKKKRRGPQKRKAPGSIGDTTPPGFSGENAGNTVIGLETQIKRQAKRIQQLEKGWDRNDRIIQKLRAENAALKARQRKDDDIHEHN